VIYGGGRWARTIAMVLDGILPKSDIITFCSPNNEQGLNEWIDKSDTNRLKVVKQYPDYTCENRPIAAIVANAARMHFPATISSLYAGIPTLVEKPFAITSAEAKFLINMTKEINIPLCAGHVFSFSRYIQNFSDMVRKCGSIENINFFWSDPIVETRYGESKIYDPTITIIHDVLPHIISLIRSLTEDRIEYKVEVTNE